MEPPDGGWGWVVCFASFLTNGVTSGIINSFGVLYIAILEESGGSAFKTSWIGSICSGLNFFMAPLASILVDKLGCRPTAVLGGTLALIGILTSSFVSSRTELMYVTYGVLMGVGFGLSFQPSLFVMGVYFKKRLGLANGFASFGASVFTIVLPFVIKKLLDIGLAPCIWFETALVLLMLLGAFTFRPLPQDKQKIPQQGDYPCDEKEIDRDRDCDETSDKEDSEMCDNCSDVQETTASANRTRCRVSCGKIIDSSIWKERPFCIWIIGLIVGCFGYFVPFFHLVKHVNDTIPDAPAEVIIMCLGGTSGIGRLASGYFSDHPKVNPVYLQLVALIVIGTCTLIIPVMHSFPGLCVLVLLMGFSDGTFVAMTPVIAFYLVGKERSSQGLGAVLGIISFPLMIGPPVAGLIYDKMGTYNIAFICFGSLAIIGGCILFLIRPARPGEGGCLDINGAATNDMPLSEGGEMIDATANGSDAGNNVNESDKMIVLQEATYV